MAYIPSHALAGLRNYKYKGVDRCDPSFILCERSLNIYFKILTLKLCIESVLELVRHSLAGVGRAKHGTKSGSQLIYTSITVAYTRLVLQITLSGLSFVLLNFATLAFYDPSYLTEKGGATGPPNWVYFTCVSLYRP
jgi:ethanolaminephosphotransferase